MTNKQPTFETKRLRLIPMDPSHLDYLFSLDSIPEVMTFIQNPTPTKDSAEKKMNHYLNYAKQNVPFGAFTVFLRENNCFAGFGFLVDVELNPEHNKIEVGYRFHPSLWGKGYASEVTNTLLEYAFNSLELEVVYGTTHIEHVVSQAVLKKVGMKEVGHAPYHTGCLLLELKNPKPFISK